MLICEFCKLFESSDKPNFSKHVKNCFANPNSLGKMQTKWDCLICDKFFVKKLEFLDHKKVHQIKQLCKCPFCGLTKIDKEISFVPYHVKYCVKNPNRLEAMVCEYCNNYSSIYLNALSQHVNNCKSRSQNDIADGITQWKCIICEIYFSTRRAKERHNKTEQHTPADFNKVVYANNKEKFLKRTILSCKHCEWTKETTKHGLGVHESSCQENPNKIVRSHTDESRKKLSEIMKERHAKNIAAKWKNPHIATSYPEKFFMKVIKNEFNDKNYKKEYPIGKWFFDFAWVDKKCAIEIDGQQHQRYKHQIESDKAKDAFAFESGWKVLRIKWKNMYNNPKKWIKIAKDFVESCEEVR